LKKNSLSSKTSLINPVKAPNEKFSAIRVNVEESVSIKNALRFF